LWASSVQIEYFNTAVFYQLLHAVVLFAITLLSMLVSHRLLTVSQIFCSIGILMFSGSLYLYVITGTKILGAITPIGGLCLILAWLLVALVMVLKPRDNAC
jgi:uncharacterized membrane protein YgdD (TMEM256/DUF423 family)